MAGVMNFLLLACSAVSAAATIPSSPPAAATGVDDAEKRMAALRREEQAAEQHAADGVDDAEKRMAALRREEQAAEQHAAESAIAADDILKKIEAKTDAAEKQAADATKRQEEEETQAASMSHRLLAVAGLSVACLAACALWKRKAGQNALAEPLLEPKFDLEQAEAALVALQQKANEVAAYAGVGKTATKKQTKREASKFAKQLSATKKQIRAMKDKESVLSKEADKMANEPLVCVPTADELPSTSDERAPAVGNAKSIRGAFKNLNNAFKDAAKDAAKEAAQATEESPTWATHPALA